MDAYKERIEAMVTPILMPVKNKNDLRRELWAHFTAAAEEERDAGRGAAEACEAALARLGTADELRASVEAEQSKLMRLACQWDRFVYPYQRRTWKSWLFGLGLTAVGLAVFSPFCVIIVNAFTEKITFERSATLGVVFAVEILWCYVLAACIIHFVPRAEIERSKLLGPRPAWIVFARLSPPLFGSILIAPLILGVGYAGLGLIIGWNDPRLLEYAYIMPFMILFNWFSVAMALVTAISLEAKHANPVEDWPYTNAG